MDTWISALSSLVLVGVTGWYAVLTRRLAVSARESAASAERTAQIAAEALAASVAGLDVQFAIYPNWRDADAGSGSALGVSVSCGGATVFVHRARLDEMWVLEGEKRKDGHSSTLLASDRELVLDRGDVLNPGGLALPVRLHRHETVHFDADPQLVMPLSTVAQLEVTVWYSLSANGDLQERRAAFDLAD